MFFLYWSEITSPSLNRKVKAKYRHYNIAHSTIKSPTYFVRCHHHHHCPFSCTIFPFKTQRWHAWKSQLAFSHCCLWLSFSAAMLKILPMLRNWLGKSSTCLLVALLMVLLLMNPATHVTLGCLQDLKLLLLLQIIHHHHHRHRHRHHHHHHTKLLYKFNLW